MKNAGKALVFIVGPTAAGKTRLAIKLARKTGGEIISADSMQVYKGMAVTSQAPTAAERRLARHHLTGFLDPRKEESVASFRKMAVKAINSIVKRGKIPVIVGGSGLYVKALVDGLFPSPKADLKYRKRMQAYCARHGSPELHKKLSRTDPVSAKRIHPNDERRIIRALEIYHTAGKTMTELSAETRGLKDEYRIFLFGLNMPRGKLYTRIGQRVDHMFRAGLVSEIRRLSKKKLSRTAGVALGLREVGGYLRGEYDLGSAKDLLKRNTRRFAKRQLTWFRGDKRVKWFDVSRVSEADIIRKIVKVTRICL